VKRVVLISTSLSAKNDERIWENKTYTEQNLGTLDKVECAAVSFWEEAKSKNGEKCFDLVTIAPAWVLGPVLSSTSSVSVIKFSRVFYETVEKVENVARAVCDVRDVALALIRAAELKETAGQRILIASSNKLVMTSEWVDILREQGYKVASVGKEKTDRSQYEKAIVNNTKMINLLGIQPIELRKTLVDMTESLIKYGIITI
jgi:nucleoside-diphosphate-sugar epimerase